MANMTTQEILQGIKDWAAPKVIYDISAAHNNTKYTDLSDALGTNGGNIPQEYRKGGITVRFVRTYDNKYVQYRFMLSGSFTTAQFANGANWRKEATNDVLNVNDAFNHPSAFSTKQEARNTVTLQSGFRKKGLIITYKYNSGSEGESDSWITEQYYNGDIDYETWSSDVRWKNIASDEINALDEKIHKEGQYINVNTLIPLSSGFYTLSTAITALYDNYQELCTKGAIITFNTQSNKWALYQYKGTEAVTLRTEWIKSANWELLVRPRPVFVPASAGITGINNVLWNNPNGCIIELEEGTYTGTEAINMANGGSATCSNCLIIGKGINTIISRTSGSDLIATVGSNNIITNCNFAHSVNKKFGAIVLYQCIVNGVYKDDSVKSAYDLKIASPTSTAQARMNADIICSASAAQSAINSAINSLSNGGTIILAAGTYTLDSYIDLRGKANITIIGSGSNTVISRTGGGNCFMDDSTTTNCCIQNIKYGGASLNYTQRVDVWERNLYTESNPNTLNVIKILPSQGIAAINNAIYSLVGTGGTILLSAGTYTGSDPIGFYKSTSPTGYASNIKIVGQGESTVISRNTNVNDMVANNVAVSNIVFDGVKFAHSIQRSNGINPVKMVRLVNCYIGNVYVDESAESSLNVINVGEGRFYTKLSQVLDIFFQSGVPIGKDNRWEIHLYGHIIENTMVSVSKNYIDLIGHNCVIEIQGGKNQYFQFIDQEGSYYGPGLDIVVKDIHFLKTGCYAYWDSPCVNCLSSWVTFENCIFENATSNPMPFNQADYTVGYEDMNGGRRHGIEVYCYKYGTECKTKFVNCVAIGSPYGTNSSRGFYLVIGQPKLFNCIGYGGGYGEFGHGIINHRASRAELFSCIGYAGEHSYRQAAGIRFQACGSSQLNGCIGYPSYGTKLISNGVKATAVERICTELGLMVTDYVSGGVVDFNAVKANTSLCAKINNDDIDLVEVEASTEESYGFSFWANSGVARLLNCKGYIGSGENSKALHCIAKSEPTIIGGYFGLEDIMTNTYFKADTGQNYMTFRPQNNIYSPIKCRKVAASITFAPVNGDKLYIRTDESTPQYLVNGFDMTGLSSIVNPTFESIVIPAGSSLVVYIKNGDTMKQITEDSMMIHFCYNYIANSTSALYIADEAKPIIKGSVLRNHANKDAISVGSGVSNIKVFDCLCEGTVDSGITFASKTTINGSSNYSI